MVNGCQEVKENLDNDVCCLVDYIEYTDCYFKSDLILTFTVYILCLGIIIMCHHFISFTQFFTLMFYSALKIEINN